MSESGLLEAIDLSFFFKDPSHGGDRRKRCQPGYLFANLGTRLKSSSLGVVF